MDNRYVSPRPAHTTIRDPQNFVAGLILMGFAVVGWLSTSDLEVGTLFSMGPGLLPRFLMVCLAGFGVFLSGTALVQDGPSVRLSDFSAILAIAALVAAAVAAGSLMGPGDVFGLAPFAFVFCVLYLALMVGLVVLSVRRSTWLDRSGLRGPIFVVGGVLAFALTVRSCGLFVAGPLLALISGAAAPDTRFGELVIFAIAVTLLSVGLFKYVLQLPMPALVIPGVIYL
ncbi:tripartite tricarboxylate transporter TctB family protein [Aquabacter sp. CN5-332]|uniref:tripartite tricarboxylate transporter TctB family protein n=1 Tax=Aquabacter sp. CN5-332 TaxID=3156608 RepID=UPI0032B3CD66